MAPDPAALSLPEAGILDTDCILGPPPPADLQLRGLASDSREVRSGYLFAALRGSASHGADHVGEAARRGAGLALASPAGALRALDRNGRLPLPVLVDPEPRRRLAFLANRFWPSAPAVRVAVTGTNGKTSTVEFLRQIWNHAGIVGASVGTLGVSAPGGGWPGGLTSPDPISLHRWLARLQGEGVTHVALEASSHALAQARLDAFAPSVAAMCSFSRDHLDYHGDIDAYAEAKLRLFRELLVPDGSAAADVDSPVGKLAVQLASARGGSAVPVGVGADAAAGIRILRAKAQGQGGRLRLAHAGKTREISVPVVGAFQLKNALLAAAVAILAGLPADAAFAALPRLRTVRGRMEPAARLPNGASVYVDYAHTPDALAAALRAGREQVGDGRLTALVGAGGERDRGKRALMGAVAAKLADRVVIADDNPRSEDPGRIRDDIRKGAPAAEAVGDRREAIRLAMAELSTGDLLLVTGKGHEQVQETAEGRRPFDDVEVVRALAQAGSFAT